MFVLFLYLVPNIGSVKQKEGQFSDPNVESVHPPRYTYPDLPRHIPEVEQLSLGSQQAEPSVVSANVVLHGFMPTLSNPTALGSQQFHACTEYAKRIRIITLYENDKDIVLDTGS